MCSTAITENPHLGPPKSSKTASCGLNLVLLGPSASDESPSSGSEAQPERRQARPVDRAGSRVEIGGDALEPSGPSSPPSPAASDEMRDLALDEWSVRPIGGDPLGVGLLCSGVLENRLVFVDCDRAAGS